MAITNGYATEPEFSERYELSGSTERIEWAINAASRAIDRYCYRHFYQDGTSGSPVARTFEACGAYTFEFGPNNDLTAVTTPTIATDEDGDGVFETSWSSSDFQLLPFSRPAGDPYTEVEAVGSLTFPIRHGRLGRRDRVEITGVWGWDEVPDEVHEACLIKAAKIFTRTQAPNGFAGVNDFGPVAIRRGDDPDVVSLIDPYKLTAVLVA
jgi:hypothetical protein